MSAVALERFCAETLEAVRGITLRGEYAHARYRELFVFLRERDDIIAAIFDDQRRSSAYLQIARAVVENVLQSSEVAELSPETQAAVRMIAGIESEA